MVKKPALRCLGLLPVPTPSTVLGMREALRTCREAVGDRALGCVRCSKPHTLSDHSTDLPGALGSLKSMLGGPEGLPGVSGATWDFRRDFGGAREGGGQTGLCCTFSGPPCQLGEVERGHGARLSGPPPRGLGQGGGDHGSQHRVGPRRPDAPLGIVVSSGLFY